jgi:CrcB protein
MQMILAVAAGGAFGAVARYLVVTGVGRLLGPHDFPWGTLTVNVVGSVLMGVLIELMALVWSPSQELRAFLVIGILGAFTTFSTFSLDVAVLVERGHNLFVAAYVAGSVALCVGGLFAAMHVMRAVLR